MKTDQAKIETRVGSWRYYLVLGVMVILAASLVARVVFLQVVNAKFLKQKGLELSKTTIPAYRGLITDRNGEPLAVSTVVKSIVANPQLMVDEQIDWSLLASKLGMTEKKLRQKIQRGAANDRTGVLLKRWMAPHKAEEIMNLGIDGIATQTEYRRYYPAGEVAAHVVGIVDTDEIGIEGMELAYNELLAGMQGTNFIYRDRTGRVIKDVERSEDEVPAKPGQNLQLSIDLRAQYLAYKELLTAVTEYKASAGSVVALDIHTGEVLAMANYPSYNPNNRRHTKPGSFRNRAVTDVFEPGSTVKPFAVAAALESGKWRPNSHVDTTPGFIRIGKNHIRDSGNYGEISLAKVIAKSSNVGVSKVALTLQPEAIANVFQRVGFGGMTGISFPGESLGLIPYRHTWKPIDIASLSFGYGLSTSSLQLAKAYSVIASGGIKKTLSLLKTDAPAFNEAVMGADVAADLMAMLETVTAKNGTGYEARVPGYRVAGKTGTVHKVKRGSYQDNRYISLFAGIAPVENPQLVLVVVIDDPKGADYYGGKVAAPVFSRVMGGLLRIKNVPPDNVSEHLVQVNKNPQGSPES